MSRIGDTIQQGRTAKGITIKQLAKKAGVAEQFIIDVESGKRIINDTTAGRILKIIGVGEAELADYSPAADERAQTAPKPRTATPKPAQEVRAAEQDTVQDIWKNALGGVVQRVNIVDIGLTPVGYRMMAIEQGRIAGALPARVFYLKMPDDSLAALRIREGDLLLTVPATAPESGKYMLIEYNGTRAVRLMRQAENKRWNVQSFDRTLHSQLVAEKDIVVLGKCVRVEFDLGDS